MSKLGCGLDRKRAWKCGSRL